MKNQVLSIEHMQKLKELGIDTSKASMCYISKYPSCDFDDGDSIVVVSKDFNKRLYNEFGPAFTLQDIIDLLPAKIQRNAEYDLTIYKDFLLYSCEGKNKCVASRPLIFFNSVELFTDIEIGLIGAAYEMLIWVAENGYLTSK